MLLFSRSSRNERGGDQPHPPPPHKAAIKSYSSRGTLAVNGTNGINGHGVVNRATSLYRQNGTGTASSVTAAAAAAAATDEQPLKPRGSVHRRSLLRRGGNRPHSWHSTLQRGFQRARSRSSGRNNDRDSKNLHNRSSASLLSSAGYAYGRPQSEKKNRKMEIYK